MPLDFYVTTAESQPSKAKQIGVVDSQSKKEKRKNSTRQGSAMQCMLSGTDIEMEMLLGSEIDRI